MSRAVRLSGAGKLTVVANSATSSFSRRFQPFRVQFNWVNGVADLLGTRAIFFCRAKDPVAAGVLCHGLWNYWQRKKKGLTDFDEYPRVCSIELGGKAEVTVLSDKSYAEIWETCRRLDRDLCVAGDMTNPRAFYPRQLCRDGSIFL